MRDAKPFIPPKFVAHFGFNTGTSESTELCSILVRLKKTKMIFTGLMIFIT